MPSKQYLETLSVVAKNELDEFIWKQIQNKARAQSGGFAKHQNQCIKKLTLQKITHESIQEASNGELTKTLIGLNTDLSEATSKRRSTNKIAIAAAKTLAEMKKRNMVVPTESELAKLATEENEMLADKVLKGFLNGDPEAGLHTHTVLRTQKITMRDGAHLHMFLLPDNSTLFTDIGGEHEHGLKTKSADRSLAKVAKHSHRLRMMNGEVLETEEDGEHDHELMVETTGFDGGHTHILKLKDGTKLRSLTAGEFYDKFGPFKDPEKGMPPATTFTQMLMINELHSEQGGVLKSNGDSEDYADSGNGSADSRNEAGKSGGSKAPSDYRSESHDIGALLSSGLEVSKILALTALGYAVHVEKEDGEKAKKEKKPVAYKAPDEIAKLEGVDDEKFDSCVKQVMGQGQSESSAFAICTSQFKKAAGKASVSKIEKALGDRKQIPIRKVDHPKRIVYAVVTEPESEDAHDDVMSVDEIEKAAHFYLVNSRTVGINHEKQAKADVVESYLAPVDFTWEGEKIKKGSWVLGVHVKDDDQWEMVEDGTFNAFSVGGFGLREDED